ncbi:hypothetical protein [Streptomyces sp. CB02460]|uniref:hypothetical protein n=1 Tax=Streptomyces sp. CB02460 TaxID=1703941 RepID=UPI0023796E90|nr:hypothetical protein [Streptomyces sp. CB02460]
MVPFFVEANPYVRGIVPNIGRIAEALRAAGGLVAWVLPANEAPLGRVSGEFYGPVVSQTFAATGGEGPPRTRVWHAFDVRPDDLVVEKNCVQRLLPSAAAYYRSFWWSAERTPWSSLARSRTSAASPRPGTRPPQACAC